MDVDTFNRLDNLISKICVERGLWEEKKVWSEIKADKDKLQVSEQRLLELQKKFEQVNKDAEKLSQPPLQYAVYLGVSSHSEHDLIIGQGYTRMEARVIEELLPLLKDLRLGQTVLLNDKQSVVAIRGDYVVGQTSEVVNIIVPEGEAKIQSIIPGTPTEFVVVWRENEEITIVGSPALRVEDIHVGDFVQVDAEGKVALPREKPRLHVKASGNEGTVVEISDRLYAQGIKIGDIVRIEPNLKFAFEKLPAYETGELTLEEVPDVTYDDIGGLDEQIEQIYDAIELPYLYRDTFERYQLSRPKGILLHGPPGCGKTMIAKAVANNLTRNIREHLRTLERYIVLYQLLQQQPDDAQLLEQLDTLAPSAEGEPTPPLERLALLLRQYDIQVERLDDKLEELRSVLAKKDGVRSFFLNVKGPELLDKYVGETEHRIRKIFEIARSHATYYTPVIIFFDEMEAMFRTRGSGRSSDIETTIVPQFLAELDGVETSTNLVIIGASNRQDMIDPAILRPKRLDVKVRVSRPDRKAARDIFSMYLLPSLPLSAAGITLPVLHTEAPACVFRTAYPDYYPPPSDSKLQTKVRAINADTAGLLPINCDFRLALSLQEEIDELAKLPPTSTIRDALALEQEGNLPWNKLRRFKLELEIADVVRCLRALYERRVNDTAFYERVEHFVHMEWLAETLLLRANDLIYSPDSMLSVLTTKGTIGLPLKDFMSGAIIANIVDRAKRQAIKRRMVGQKAVQEGITFDDLQQAIEQEFIENKEQLAQHKLRTEWGRMDEDIQSVQIFLKQGENDPWSEPKLPMYNTSFTSSVVR